MFLNFLKVESIEGKKFTTIRNIAQNYLKSKFALDLVCLIVLMIDVSTDSSAVQYLRLCNLLKLKSCLKKM